MNLWPLTSAATRCWRCSGALDSNHHCFKCVRELGDAGVAALELDPLAVAAAEAAAAGRAPEAPPPS